MTQPTLSILRRHDGREIPDAGEYTIDAARTSVEFIVRNFLVTKVRGRLRGVSGTIRVAEKPDQSQVQVELGVASLDTGNPQRDRHLRSSDFFNVEQYPSITFRSTSVDADASGEWALTGDLTICGVTRPIKLEVTFNGANRSPVGAELIAFSATTALDREDWGITYHTPLKTGGMAIGKHVRIELTVQAVASVRP